MLHLRDALALYPPRKGEFMLMPDHGNLSLANEAGQVLSDAVRRLMGEQLELMRAAQPLIAAASTSPVIGGFAMVPAAAIKAVSDTIALLYSPSANNRA